MTREPEGFTGFVCVLFVGKLVGGVGNKDGGELRFPDGEGNLAGGRAKLEFCGGKLVLVIGGTVTVGCGVFLSFVGANGKGADKEGNGVFITGGSCGGLL